MTYSRRSNASWSGTDSSAATNSWAIRGATERAVVPHAPSATGTSRQPSTCWPSSSTVSSSSRMASAGLPGGRKHMATP